MTEDRAIALLGELLAISERAIQESLDRIRSGAAYERFVIPKPGQQKPREISAPVATLKAIQRRLKILLEPLPLSMSVHGFRRAHSIVTGARAHVNARALINIDLKDFFHSVDVPRVVRALERSLLPRLVDETGDLTRPECLGLISLIAELTTYPVGGRPRPVLPQGAPTSPFLANLAARPLDERIRKLLAKTPGEYAYTRYADDLTISATHEIDRRLIGEILRLIQRSGFAANPQKTRIASTIRGSPHFRQKLTVTKLTIDARSQTIRIPRAKLDLFRMKVFQASLVPQLDEDTNREVEGIVSFVHMVYGSLPGPLGAAYSRYCEAHKRPRLRPGRSRRQARRHALDEELYR